MDSQVSVLAFWSPPCWVFGIRSDHISMRGRRVKPLDYFWLSVGWQQVLTQRHKCFAPLRHFPVSHHQFSTWTNEHRGINYCKKRKYYSYSLFLWSRYLRFCTFTHPEANFNLYRFFFKCCELTPTINIMANHQWCFSTDANHWMTPMKKAQTCFNFKQDFKRILLHENKYEDFYCGCICISMASL